MLVATAELRAADDDDDDAAATAAGSGGRGGSARAAAGWPKSRACAAACVSPITAAWRAESFFSTANDDGFFGFFAASARYLSACVLPANDGTPRGQPSECAWWLDTFLPCSLASVIALHRRQRS